MTKANWLDNLHPALDSCWHPVGPPGATEARLLGRRWRLRRDPPGWSATDEEGRRAASVTEHLGLVWVAPEPPVPPLPAFPEAGDPDFVCVPAPGWEWSAGAGQMTDGACDITHIPFLHRLTIGNPGDAYIPAYTVEVSPDGWRASASYAHTARGLRTEAMLPRRILLDYTVPFAVRLRIEHPEEDTVLTTLFLHQPLDAARTTLWCINARTDIADGRCTPEEATALHRTVNDEDRRMLERFETRALPLDPTEEVHTRADRITLEVRRGLARLVAAAG